mmetsp:Transcript_15076/g.10557  ORF Transcript_15076/g.10557 Transcript_15076/m.10557 type:complete len:115 (-) Transcript_15076:338-682(-)
MPEDNIEETGKYYDSIEPEVYEEMMKIIGCDDFAHVARMVYESQAQGGLEVPKTANIIEFGCGTGSIGKIMKYQGYDNITGVDASKNFVEASRTSGCYKSNENLFIGIGQDKFP